MPEERKLVSVLFADLVGSTALGHDNDPEVVRNVLSRYFEKVREIVEAHGGTVEKYIGDAAMAVFGVPRVHDDDAERAVRAALAIQAAIQPLNDEVTLHLEARVGVNSGEAVAAVQGDGLDSQFLVTGDVVNVAARLQQHAEPGEVLVGALTEQLTREAIAYEEAAPLDVRGKPDPLVAFRANRPHSEVPDQARGLPGMRARLVGRTRELNLLVDTFERARDDRRSQLFTIVGNAGVGKSRLVGEFLARISGREHARLAGVVADLSSAVVKIESAPADGRPGLTVLRGRCLPYGSGVTWWPFLEILQADLGVTTAQHRAEIVERLSAKLHELLPEDRERRAVSARLRVLLGVGEAGDLLPDVPAARQPAELAWAFARYLEAIATRTPLVVVIDDLQWAEAPAIEIVRGLLPGVGDVPLVVVCVARPELLEREPTWGAGQPNASLIVLEPLNADETRTLIGRLLDIDDLPEELRVRVVARAEGNPLFCEEFVRMLIEEGRLVRDGGAWRASDAQSLDVRVPETIHALLAARLDALPPDDKRLIQAASVIGEEFEAAQVRAITGDDRTEERLAGCVRRGVVVVNRRAGLDGYRFRHLLIRDVAYSTLPKAERARLHEALGRALEATFGDRRHEVLEIVAHHAERALALSLELRISGEPLRDRARRALDLAVESAMLAVRREDLAALSMFLETLTTAADALGTDAPPGTQARIAFFTAEAAQIRNDYPTARALLTDAIAAATTAGMTDLAAAAHVSLAQVLIFSAEDQADETEFSASIAEAVRLYEAMGDVRGRIRAEMLGMELLFESGQLRQMWRRGLELADEAVAAGEPAVAAGILSRLVGSMIWAGDSVLGEEVAQRAIALAGEQGLSRVERQARFFLARLAWLRGDFARAEAEARVVVEETHATGFFQYEVASRRLLAETVLDLGRPAEARELFTTVIDLSEQLGERWSRTELYVGRATAALELGDRPAAERDLTVAHETLRDHDDAAHWAVAELEGLLFLDEGNREAAVEAFRRAMGPGRDGEYVTWVRPAVPLLEVLVDLGRYDEASALLAQVQGTAEQTGYAIRADRLAAVADRLAARRVTPRS